MKVKNLGLHELSSHQPQRIQFLCGLGLRFGVQVMAMIGFQVESVSG